MHGPRQSARRAPVHCFRPVKRCPCECREPPSAQSAHTGSHLVCTEFQVYASHHAVDPSVAKFVLMWVNMLN